MDYPRTMALLAARVESDLRDVHIVWVIPVIALMPRFIKASLLPIVWSMLRIISLIRSKASLSLALIGIKSLVSSHLLRALIPSSLALIASLIRVESLILVLTLIRIESLIGIETLIGIKALIESTLTLIGVESLIAPHPKSLPLIGTLPPTLVALIASPAHRK